MKLNPLHRFISHIALALFAISFCATLTAQAGLTLEMNVIRVDTANYYFYPSLTTNNTPPNIPFGDYYIASLNSPTNGASALYHFTTNGFNQDGGSTWGYNNFDSMKYELTNGNWSIFVTNSVTTNVYHFTVTANITSNDIPLVSITSPANDAVNVTNRPTFSWQGPTNYNGLVVYYYNNGPSLPVTQTSLLSSVVLYQGIQNFTAHYDSNSTTAVVASIPRDDALNPISSWVSTAHLQDTREVQFTVGVVDTSGTSHTLVAHYPWDGTNGDGSVSGVDTSGHNYDMNFGGSFGGQGGINSTTDRVAGPRAIQFVNGDGNSGGYIGWNPTPGGLLTALAGSFSVSCWIKTTQAIAWDDAPAFYGAGIVSADNGGLANDLVPIALTGSKIGFNTGGDSEDITLNSDAVVNDGLYHHIVVTRNQITGQKIIYVDGVLDRFSSGTTNLLDAPQLLTVGAISDANNSDASSTSYYNGYNGRVDDLQIYSGVLSSNEVAQLFSNPGATADQIITAPLVARYNFEDTNNSGMDSSGNGNDPNCGTGNGGTNLDTFSTDAAVGSYSRLYAGDTGICFSPGSSTFNNLSNALSGNFSWTAWVKTTESVNSDFANAYFGNPILFDYNSNTNRVIFSITGSKAAFTFGNPNGTDTTLHSTTSVNDGNYHFLAVTRNKTNGVMNVYVDGNFEATATSTSGSVIANTTWYLAGGYNGFFKGLLDDVRIYGGELTASDVAALAGHPISDFNTALNTTDLSWTSGGDAPWFVETTNTHDNVSAAQSGVIDDFEESWIETTVDGPGTLSFWWKVSSDGGHDFVEFLQDGISQQSLTGEANWQNKTFSISSGSHTLRWRYYKDGNDFSGLDAAFLDQVSFIQPVTVVMELNMYREQNPDFGEAYFAFPSIDSISPPPFTRHRIESPNNLFSGETSGEGTGASSTYRPSLNAMIDECTNGLWRLYINKDHSTERDYTFKISISGLTTNILQPALISLPAHGSINVATNPVFRWSGPSNFVSLSLNVTQPNIAGATFTNLPPTATNWPSPPTLSNGTNIFYVEYSSNGIPSVTFTTPVDASSQPVASWNASVNLHSITSSRFIVGASAPPQAQLISPQQSGGNFLFSFVTAAGRAHVIEARTNLTTGAWIEVTNFSGNGAITQLTFPTTNPPIRFFRVRTQ